MSLISFAKERRGTPRMHTTPPSTSASLAPHTLAMSCYGYDSRSRRSAEKQLNGHLSFQATITNRLESTFPPHLCKKIKFVPDSRQPFENDRIFNLAVGLSTDQHADRCMQTLTECTAAVRDRTATADHLELQRSTCDQLDARTVASHDRPRIFHWPHTQT